MQHESPALCLSLVALPRSAWARHPNTNCGVSQSCASSPTFEGVVLRLQLKIAVVYLLCAFPHCLITSELSSLPQSVPGGPDPHRMTCVSCPCSGDKHCQVSPRRPLCLCQWRVWRGGEEASLLGLDRWQLWHLPRVQNTDRQCLLDPLDLCLISKMREEEREKARKSARENKYEHE